MPQCGREEVFGDVLCFDKSQRIVHTVGILTVTTPGQQGLCRTLLVMCKYVALAQQCFLGWKPERSKDILNPLGLSVTRTGSIFLWFSLISDYC